MKHTSVRPADGIEQIVDTYGNMLFRLCLLTLGNTSDAEDAVQETFIHDDNWRPIYCWEPLNAHEEQGNYTGNAFDVGTKAIYESVYRAITEGAPLSVTCEMAAQVIDIIDTVHAQNPLPVKY